MTVTGTDLATTSGALAIRADQTQFTDDQLVVLRHMGIPQKATSEDLRVFLHRAQQLRLDPFAGQIHLVEYGGKPVIQVGIHGWESIARDTADAAEVDIEWEDTQWCGPDGVWADVWLSDEPPAAARAVLLRAGKRYPAVCLYREFVGMAKVYDERTKRWTGDWRVNKMWSEKPAHMLGKCARAAALRTAFPRQFSDVRIPEELGERPDTVRGEVVREDVPTCSDPLTSALELVAASSTRDELQAIITDAWPRLSVTQRARLHQAVTQHAAGLEPDSEPAPEPEPESTIGLIDAALIEAAQAACVELGYYNVADQVKLAGALVGLDVPTWPDVPAEALPRLVEQLAAAAAASDPQAAVEDLIAAVQDPPS